MHPSEVKKKMKTVTLTVKQVPELYLECENITPDTFAGKNLMKSHNYLHIREKEDTTLGEYFTIAGEAEQLQLRPDYSQGDCSKMKYIGIKMTAGEVIVNSSTDMYNRWLDEGVNLLSR